MNRHRRSFSFIARGAGFLLGGVLLACALPASAAPTGAVGSQPAGVHAAGVHAAGVHAAGVHAAGVHAADRYAGGWTRMAPSRLPRADAVTGAWTGRELLVVGIRHDGGRRDAVVAAAYSPRTDRWRSLPAPVTGPLPPMTELASVWTGRELVVWGPIHQAFDPATGRWRRLPEPPVAIGSSAYVLAWTGRTVLAWGGGCCASAERTGASYDPVRNRWTALPPSPLGKRGSVGVWTGSELVIAGGHDFDGKMLADAAAYSPSTRTWRRLPPVPVARSFDVGVWTGREVLLLGGASTRPGAGATAQLQYAYSPARNRWRPLRVSVPVGVPLTGTWTGRQVMLWTGAATVAYDPVAGTSRQLPRSPLAPRGGPVIAWTGSQLLVWGGERATDGARYLPGHR